MAGFLVERLDLETFNSFEDETLNSSSIFIVNLHLSIPLRMKLIWSLPSPYKILNAFNSFEDETLGLLIEEELCLVIIFQFL